MKESQVVHLGMINSYNVLVNKVSVDEIIFSGIGAFAHAPEERDAKQSVEFMIKYFQDIEMYERCSALQKYIEETFDENGKYKEPFCDCEYPDIKEYSKTTTCSVCNLKLKRL